MIEARRRCEHGLPPESIQLAGAHPIAVGIRRYQRADNCPLKSSGPVKVHSHDLQDH